MPISAQRESTNRYRLEIRGTLGKAEFDRCLTSLVSQIEDGGPLRLMVVLDQFDGWEAKGAWNDIGFYIQHGDAVGRIAIVGDERWRDLALMFAVADLRKAPVEFFRTDDAAAASTWLSKS